MIKARAIILFLTALTFASSAQNIKIRVDNTEPRLGQEFVLTLETGFLEEFLKDTFMDSLEFKHSHSDKDLTRTIIPKRLGRMTIGPIRFDCNGVTYLSNSLTINVVPNLSDKEGVWIRKLKIDDTDYIVIEQISIIKPVTTGSANTWNTEWKATEDNLVILDKEPQGEGVEFFETRSGMGGHPDKSKGYPHSVSYSYKFYEVKKLPEFKGGFKLKDSYFKNLPKGTKIPDIIIE